MSNETLTIFDTTLRDGEQSPGINLSTEDKVQIAKMLERLKVNVIEAGFAAASEGNFQSVQAVARVVKDSTVASLSRATERDIDLSAEAVRPAKSGRIHIVLATSPVHMKYKLQMQPGQVLEQAIWAVQHARKYSDDVEFSCEDASRSEFEFLARLVEGIIRAGVTTVSLPDTVGAVLPNEYGALIGRLLNEVPNADKVTFSAHCHDDLGLAVANSLAAVKAGARQVECTINGIGERAGNASLEEIVMALRTRQDYFNVRTTIDTKHLVPTSQLVSKLTGFVVPPNKAIVGRNAFAHESGIHQDGMLKNPNTYQIMVAEDVGWQDYRLVLGKHSGRNGFRAHMKKLGVEFSSEDQLSEVFNRFKKLADTKFPLEDADLLALVENTGMSNSPISDDEIARRELQAVLADIDAHPWPTDIGEARILYDKMGPPMAADIRAEQYVLGGVPAQVLTPPESDPDRALFFLHGGGYVYGSYLSHQGMAAEVARAAKCKGVQPNYRLAPENKYPAAVDDACAAYEALLREGLKPEKIGFVGDSAGGGLVMSTLLALKEKGRPLPGAVVCISPWVDLEANGESFRTRQAMDPMLDRKLCVTLAKEYLGDVDPRSPKVSSIHADLRGLPPMLVQVGEREVLFSEAETLANRAREAGVDVTFEEWPQMVHVWHLYFHMLGKGREAIARVGAFVREKTA